MGSTTNTPSAPELSARPGAPVPSVAATVMSVQSYRSLRDYVLSVRASPAVAALRGSSRYGRLSEPKSQAKGSTTREGTSKWLSRRIELPGNYGTMLSAR